VTTALPALKDALARVRRALDAFHDGDLDFCEAILVELAADLWPMIERLEKEAGKKS
jgi:hypothetical protein